MWRCGDVSNDPLGQPQPQDQQKNGTQSTSTQSSRRKKGRALVYYVRLIIQNGQRCQGVDARDTVPTDRYCTPKDRRPRCFGRTLSSSHLASLLRSFDCPLPTGTTLSPSTPLHYFLTSLTFETKSFVLSQSSHIKSSITTS